MEMARRGRYVAHSARDVEGIRRAARATAEVRELLRQAVRPGVSTLELDQLAQTEFERRGGSSAFHNYRGFPGQICISVNDEVVHGIGRANRIIQVGELVSMDVGMLLNGYIGDTATTVSVGPPRPEIARLLEVTESSLEAGLRMACRGKTVWDISSAIERLAKGAGFGIVEDFVGHGCGKKLHEPPEVPNYARRESRRDQLHPGMVLAVEPMVNMGTHKVKIDPDGWTVRTTDGAWSAHFEHMALITDSEPEILTCLNKKP